MSMDFIKNALKKGFCIVLDKKPIGIKGFIDEIERYLKRDNLNFKFIKREKPALISIERIMYKCELMYNGRSGWTLEFLPV